MKHHVCQCGRVFIRATGVVKCACGADLPFAPTTTRDRLDIFHDLWRELHRYAFETVRWSAIEAARWFDDWLSRVPTQDCACGDHFRKLIHERSKRPDFSSREAFFLWTVARHNDVNAKLGKPRVSLEKAMSDNDVWLKLPSEKPRVGFLSVVYSKIGGTETWHQSILPRLKGVQLAGLAITSQVSGDPAALGCRWAFGEESAKYLAASVDVLVFWGIDCIERFLPDRDRPKVVCVHHADLSNQWNTGIATQPGVDVVVAVNPEVARELGGIYIPNAVDPARAIAGEPMRIFQCRMCGHTQVDKVGDGKGFLQVCKGCNSRGDWDEPVSSEQLPLDKKVVVWCARFSPEKRVNLAIDAARVMPDWHFVIIGSGSDQPVNPPVNVTLAGSLPSQAEWLAAADVFLSTGDQEGFGYSMAEAMLASVPVVATPFGLGANAEIVTQLSANPSPEEIAASIRNADTAKVQKAREFIQQNHSVGAVVEHWESLIASVAAR